MTNIKIGHTCLSQQIHARVPFHVICKEKSYQGVLIQFYHIISWMPGAKTWVLKLWIYALSTLLYEHAKSVHFNSLWNKFVNESNFNCQHPTPHTTYISLIVAIKAKCLVFHCSRLDWNETSERIDRRDAALQERSLRGAETRRSCKADLAWWKVKCACEAEQTCLYYVHTNIYIHVHVCRGSMYMASPFLSSKSQLTHYNLKV